MTKQRDQLPVFIRIILFSCLAVLLNGCSSFSYYVDMVNGHYDILQQSHPLDEVIDSDISAELKGKLLGLQKARQFASSDLLLPDNNSYRRYADIGRDYVVWNVIAAPRFSIEANQWCFVFTGCLSYRGYYTKRQAEQYAQQLKQQGYDIYVAGVRAYSTLGWTDDPILNTMLYDSEAYRVGILFHELAHQKIYIEDDSAFNEAFATTIEIEGIKRWFKKSNNQQKLRDYLVSRSRQLAFNRLLRSTRHKLAEIYQNENRTSLEEKKKEIFKQLKQDYLQLKKKWNGYSGYDAWMSQDLNNAHLAIVSTYHDRVPQLQALLKKHNGDLLSFYTYINSLAGLSVPQRQEKIKTELGSRVTADLAD